MLDLQPGLDLPIRRGASAGNREWESVAKANLRALAAQGQELCSLLQAGRRRRRLSADFAGLCAAEITPSRAGVVPAHWGAACGATKQSPKLSTAEIPTTLGTGALSPRRVEEQMLCVCNSLC